LAVGASGIVAVVVVALLVVASQRAETGGQVWGGGPSGGAAPASHPSGDQFWGAPIDPAELLEGDFNGFGFVFEQTRDPNWPQDDSQPDLALLDDHTALMYASAESPSLSGGTVVLAAVDLPSGEVRWQADVGDALEGFYYGGAIVRDACGTGEGGALVNLASMGADIETVMVRLEPDGQVASVMENVVCEEIVDGKAVFGGEVDWDGAHEVLVSGLDRLKDPLWRAVASEAWLSPLVLESEAGDFVLTADGYVDAATGRPAAFGGDADARWPDTFYAMTESGVVLRGHVEQGLAEVAALDPATGDELWRTDVAEDDSIAEGAATGEEEEYDDRPLYDLYLSLEYGGGRVFLPGENGCRVLDEVTGEEVFVTDAGDFFGVTGRTLVVATYDEEETFVGLSLDDGHQLFAVRPCGPAELEDFGRLGLGVLYAVCWDADTESVALAGFDLEGGAELWSVPFPDEFWVETSIDDPFLVFGAGQAFLWSVFSGPERPGIEEWECLFPLEAH
jgi:outer membrane protein assembly factor BamB